MNKTQKLTMSAMMVALALAISLTMKLIPILRMPQGGSFSLAMLPLFILAFSLGLEYGLIGAVSYGVLNFIIDGYAFHWASFFFDYLFAFGVIGFAGLFKKAIRGEQELFVAVIFVCCLIRFIFHTISGMLAYDLTLINSAIYNSMYMFSSTIGVIVVGILVYNPISNYVKSRDIRVQKQEI